MPASRPRVSVCFPAYQEVATLAAVLDDAHQLLAGSGLDYELLVCDDGSGDGTAAIAAAAAMRIPRLRVLTNPRNLGIRATFERLYAEAAGELVFLNSTDGQWPTRVLFDLLPRIGEFDVVIAARANKHYGLARALTSWIFNAVPRLLFGVETFDAGAVKLMRREIIERFPVRSRSPFNEAERLIRAARAGRRIGAVTVATRPRVSGRARGVRLSLLWLAAIDVARLWLDLRRSVVAVEKCDNSEP